MNKISISIEKPCSEKYENFRKTSLGGFCDSCSKEVIDFTAMSDKELVDFLSNGSSNMCGRLKKSQLGTYPIIPQKTKRKWAMIPIFFAFTALLIPDKSPAQQKPTTEQMDITKPESTYSSDSEDQIYITGIVRGSDSTSLPGANILLKGTAIGTVSDMEGKFTLVLPSSQLPDEPIINFSFVGYITQEVTVGVQNQHINVVMDEMILGGFGDTVLGGYVVRRFSPRNWFGVRGVWRRMKYGVSRLTHKN